MNNPERSVGEKRVHLVLFMTASLVIFAFIYAVLFRKAPAGLIELCVAVVLASLAYFADRQKRTAYKILRGTLWFTWVITGCVVGVFVVILISTKCDILFMHNERGLPFNFVRISRFLLATFVLYLIAFALSLASYLALTTQAVTTHFRKA